MQHKTAVPSHKTRFNSFRILEFNIENGMFRNISHDKTSTVRYRNYKICVFVTKSAASTFSTSQLVVHNVQLSISNLLSSASIQCPLVHVAVSQSHLVSSSLLVMII